MRYALGIIFLVTMILPAQQSQPPSPSRGEGKKQPNATQTTPTQAQPKPPQSETYSNTPISRETRSEAQASKDNQDRRDQQANRRYTLWLSVITTIVLAIQVWLLINQNGIMKHQSTLMDGQLRATSEAANAATRAANSAEAALAKAERAYLTITNWTITNIEVGKELLITFMVVNTGRTPARLKQIRAHTHYSEMQPSPPPDMGIVFNGMHFLGAGKAMGKPLMPSPVLTDQLISILKQGWFWVFVELTYSADLVDGDRTFKICMRFDREKLVVDPSGEHNYAD